MTPQTYHDVGGPHLGAANLPKLQARLNALKLDGVIVPHDDEYRNECLPACYDRLLWVSGFSGSAGAALVLKDRAVMFTDGRYTEQVRAQTDPALFTYQDLTPEALAHWLQAEFPAKARLAYDPRLHTQQ